MQSPPFCKQSIGRNTTLNQPSILRKPLWTHYEERLLELFIEALRILQTRNLTTRILEDDINRELRQCLRIANLALRKVGRGFDSTPVFNAPIQPDLNDECKVPQENKKPDFQHELIDDQAPAEDAYKCYHIECKRLGKSPSKGRSLMKDYVDDGILRYREDSHRYGHRCCSGTMIGYIQDMDNFDDILLQVNEEATKYKLANLSLSQNGWQISGTSRLGHDVDRPFPITPFKLRHFWIDIRRHYTGKTPTSD